MSSDEGHALWRSEVKRLLSSQKDSERRLTRLELEYRARQALLKAHADHVKNSSDAEVPDHFDKAEDFLLRIWEIHEAAFGRNHVGTAAACLSLGNLCVINSDFAQAKQWFKSAIEIFGNTAHPPSAAISRAYPPTHLLEPLPAEHKHHSPIRSTRRPCLRLHDDGHRRH